MTVSVEALPARNASRPTQTATVSPSINNRSVAPVLAVIGGLALILRLWNVGARAMHLDESTVAWFAWQLLTGHGYAYDPVYHGPFQHELLAAVFLVFQSSETTARLPAVVFGVGLVLLPWFLRDYLPKTAMLVTSFLLAVSPTFVYFARFERDDTYMEFWTFLMVVLALRFLRDRKPWQVYGCGFAFAMAFATKESIYIVMFMFGSFLALALLGLRFQGFRASTESGRLPDRALVFVAGLLAIAVTLTLTFGLYAPVPIALAVLLAGSVLWFWSTSGLPLGTEGRSVLRSHVFGALTLVLGIEVVMYSTFGTNLTGLWDTAHPLIVNGSQSCQYTLPLHLDPCRKDILGGLFYWLSQHQVARGGQPWYYYFLLYALYEQLAVLLGGVAIVRTLVSRALNGEERALRLFLVFWAVMAFGIYSWAGEKFPWLGIHPLLPLTILAGFGVADLISAKRWIGASRSVLVLAGVILVLELHNTYVVNYVDGANAVEMMVYGQSPQNTASDARRIINLSHRATDGLTLPVTIDSADDWPFAWYLRTMTAVAYPGLSSTGGPLATQAPYVTNPIVILDSTHSGDAPTSLTKHYSVSSHPLIWWFPETYKSWTWSSFFSQAINPRSWQGLWDWEIYRTPFGPRETGTYQMYVKHHYFPAL